MLPLPALLALLTLMAISDPIPPVDGRLVDATTLAPIGGAEITVVGQRGTVTTDKEGRFRWAIPPPMPAVVVVVLPGGRVARPISLASIDAATEVTLAVNAMLGELVVVLGVAPGIDASPAAATTRVTARDLALRHPPTLSQALDVIPGVSAISEGQGAVPAIRGMARGRTLILVDGSRAATERRAGANASFLDPGIVQSIDVARGPGSVAYGSDAFGGVIAARTRGPEYDGGIHVRAAGTVGAGVPETRGDLELARGHGTGGVLVAVRAREFDAYDAPSGEVANSGWRDSGVRARWDQAAGGGRWSVGWQSDFARDVGRPRSDSGMVFATSPIEDSHRLTASFEGGSLGGFRNVRFNALGGASRQVTDQERLPTATRPRSVEQADLSSYEMQMRLTGERALGRARLHVGADVQGRYGLEALDTVRAYNLAGAQTSETTTISIESAHRTGVGLFAESSALLTRQVMVSGGVRVDGVRNTNVGGFFGDRTASHAALAGLAAVTVSPTPQVTIVAQVARGFRDPVLSDRYYRGPVGRGFVEGNPDLRPETSLQSDLTARYTAGPLRLVAAGYHYRITDLVERYAATPTLFLVRNRARAELQGVEIEAQWALSAGLDLAATAEVSRGRDASDGTPVDDVAPRAGSVSLRHHGFGSRVVSYARVKAVGAHDAAGPSEVPTGSYTLVDVGASWRVTPHLELVGTARNLLNEAYQSSAGPRWVWAPGRHAAITLVATFAR
jgi:outer membrane receptor protein involved in Fe transport